ncbi:MAG: bile acid:sodium symporter [Pseudomonadales bacterium]|nr:bile acid:sodium symporter [Pseudomonadales bacterium]
MSVYLQVFLPLAMFLMMFIIGTDLVLDDFRLVMKSPSRVLIATTGQLIGLPFLACILAFVLRPDVILVVGLLVTAAAPGGGISNIITARLKGNTALSVTLTAISSVACLITMPIVFALMFMALSMNDSTFGVPALPIVAQLLLLLLLPVLSGMYVRYKAERYWYRYRRKLHSFNSILLVIVIVYSLTLDEGLSKADFIAALPLAGAFLMVCWMSGYCFARLMKVTRKDRIALEVEFLLRSGAVPSMIIVTVFQRIEWLAFPAAYVFLQLSLALLLVLVYRLRAAAEH